MFNLGFSEIVVLAVIGLLVLGPKQLPEVARKVARMLNELKRVADEALAPVNEMKSQAQEYVNKTREEFNNQNQALQKSLNNLENKAHENIDPVIEPVHEVASPEAVVTDLNNKEEDSDKDV